MKVVELGGCYGGLSGSGGELLLCDCVSDCLLDGSRYREPRVFVVEGTVLRTSACELSKVTECV